MKVSFIGSGNVATHLALACVNNHIEVKDIYSKTYSNADVLAKKCNAIPVQNINELSNDIDLLILAVSDNALQNISAEIEHLKCPIVHTSGSTSMEVLGSQNHTYGVLYPLQTFSANKELSIKSVPFFIESNSDELIELLEEFCEKIGTSSQKITSGQRLNLHIAAVFACNFSNRMYSIANEILQKHNLDFELLKPLIKETASKIEHISPIDAQTGPALRNDTQTIEKHLAALTSEKHLFDLYKAISEDIIKSQKN